MIPDPEKILNLTSVQTEKDEPQEMYLFEDGAVVFWNFTPENQIFCLNLIKKCEQQSFDANDVQNESEDMCYSYSEWVDVNKNQTTFSCHF